MNKIIIVPLVFLTVLSYAENNETNSVFSKKSMVKYRKQRTPEEVMDSFRKTYTQLDEIRKKNCKLVFDKKSEITDQEKEDLKKIIYLFQDVYSSPLNKNRKSSIIFTLRMSLFLRIEQYKGSGVAYVLSLVPELTNKDAQIICLETISSDFSDNRCVPEICKLLDSKIYKPSGYARTMLYDGLCRFATDSVLISTFKKEYEKKITLTNRWQVSMHLAWCGDKTATPFFIKQLKKKRKLADRSVIRTFLIKLYSVDLGDDTEAWEKLVEEKKKENSSPKS